MTEEVATNPDEEVAEQDTSAEDVSESHDDQADESEVESAATDEAESEVEEVDWEGKKYAVPKELKDALMRQSDYTRKTQEIAETRRALEAKEAEIQQRAQVEEAHLNDLANLRLVDGVLSKYQNVNWQAENQNDPVATQAKWIDYQQAMQARQALAGRISEAQQQRGLQQQRDIAKRLQESEEALRADEKSWTPEKSAQLSQFIRETYGYTVEELAQSLSPRFVRAMRDAMVGRQAIKNATQKAPPAPAAKPITTLKANKPAPRGLSDELSIDEWMRRLDSRGAMDPAEKRRRLQSALHEIADSLKRNYFRYIVNWDLRATCEQLHEGIISQQFDQPSQDEAKNHAAKLIERLKQEV
jgi:hypothetical protein